MNCKYIKKKLNGKIYCTKLNKEIKSCASCKHKEYPLQKSLQSSAETLQKKSKKLAKLERNRFSILTNDLDHCIICGAKKDHLHEVFFGASRKSSMQYGCVIPLCAKCHSEMHINKEWQDYWHKKGQEVFIATYPDLDFIEIFKKNYL